MEREMSHYERPNVFEQKCLRHDINPSRNTAVISAFRIRTCTFAIDPLQTFQIVFV